jgi:hypothetical protein
MVTLHDVTQGTDEWQQLRAGKYTGSNAHKLLKYGTIPYSLTENTGFNGTFWTKRGNLLEAEALELYERITKAQITRPGFITNDHFPGCGFSPDALTGTAVIEVKCFDEPKHLKVLAGDIPLEILAQIHFGMLICERKLAKLVLYNPKLEPKKALGIISISANRSIKANFKRILSKQGAKK